MNFMFEWREQYLTSESVQRTSDILFLSREHKIHIFELTCNVVFITDILMTAFLTIFRRFPTTFRRFSKIVPKVSRTFPNIFRKFPKIAEDFQGRPEDVPIIHQRIEVQFKRQTWYQWSSISSLVRIWKLRHWSPGCSFVWILRVVYFSVKHSWLYQ